MEKELKEETPHCVRGDTYWEGEKTPSQLTPEKTLNPLWVQLEEGNSPSSNIGDPSSLTLLGMTSKRSFRAQREISSVQSKVVKVPLSNLPQNNHNLSRGSFEGVMSNPLNLIGDPSQRQLGVTNEGNDETLRGHLERSERSPPLIYLAFNFSIFKKMLLL
jgi:hypothetical protein